MPQFINHSFDDGGDIGIVSLQNMVNNDQFLYDEVVRRPRGIISYAEIYGGADSLTQNIQGWSDIKDNNNSDVLKVAADVEDNRIIKIEVYIPMIQIRGPIVGDLVTFPTSWAGVRILRDGAQLGKPVGNHYWPVPFTSGSPWGLNRDRRSLYLVAYDFPDAGRVFYNAQWKNNNLGNVNGNSAGLAIRIKDGVNDLPNQQSDPIAYWAARLPPSQLIITDMGSSEGLDVPPNITDKRNRDKISSVDTSDIVHNVRRAKGTRVRRRGF